MTQFTSTETIGEKTPAYTISVDGSNLTLVTAASAEQKAEERKSSSSVPWLSKILNVNYSTVGRLLWLAVVFTCFSIMMFHLMNRVQYFVSKPVAVRINFEQNTSMVIPRITVCHSYFFRYDVYEQVRSEVASNLGLPPEEVTLTEILTQMTLLELHHRVAFNLSDMMTECAIQTNKVCSEIGEWRTLYSVQGICYTFYTNYSMNVSGTYNGLRFILQAMYPPPSIYESWRVLVHDTSDTAKVDVALKGVTVKPGSNVDIKIKLRTFKFQNIPGKICSNISASTCFTNCLSDLILQHGNCRVPFMEDVNASYCGVPYQTLADDIITKMYEGLLPPCRCIPPCKRNYFENVVDTIYSEAAHSRNQSRVTIFYEDFTREMVSEELAYGFVPLLCDIGGSLGFFLGVSVLTLIHLLESAIIYIKIKWEGKKPENINPKKCEKLERIFSSLKK